MVTDPLFIDAEALKALLICECRIIYKNKAAWEYITKTIGLPFREGHQALKKRSADKDVKECVNDVLLMVYDD